MRSRRAISAAIPRRGSKTKSRGRFFGALAEESGSILAFLPGQGEILRVAALLEERVRDPDVDIAPLYGAMDPRAQDRAVAPAPKGRRKIVLATSIAETSLTIEGVRVVVDSGLMRVPRYEPDVGLTRLETVRVSRANADQRRGRAGRVEPGVCYRLWEEAGTGGLAPFAQPEILAADLAGLALDLAVWGVADPGGLKFLDSPPRAAFKEARALLASLGALDGDGKVTDEGKAIAGLALPPRLARMVVDAARVGEARLAAELAVVLTERGLGGDAVDLTRRLEDFRRDRSPRAEDARRLARNLASRALALTPTLSASGRGGSPFPACGGRGRRSGRMRAADVGEWLAAAFPDRIAMARGKRGEFLMANGRAATLEPHDPLAGEAYLAIGEIVGRAAAARVVAAAPLTIEQIEAVAGGEIETREETAFDRASASLRARRRRKLGALTLVRRQPQPAGGRASALALARGILDLGLGAPAVDQAAGAMARAGRFPPPRRRRAVARPCRCRARRFARLARAVPARQDAARRIFRATNSARRCTRCCPTTCARRLEAEAPSHYVAPTGTAAPVDYEVRGRAERRAAGAGAVRPCRPSRARRRPRAADAASAVARAPADPDHPRPAGLLEGLVGGRARRPARPLSPPFLARRPGERSADQPGETEGDVRGEHAAAPLAGRIRLIATCRLCYQREQIIQERYHMPAVTIRNLSAETHRALKLRAARHGRSAEAEVRAILDEAVRPKGRLKLGAELAAFGRRFGGVDLETTRDPSPTEPASFA